MPDFHQEGCCYDDWDYDFVVHGSIYPPTSRNQCWFYVHTGNYTRYSQMRVFIFRYFRCSTALPTALLRFALFVFLEAEMAKPLRREEKCSCGGDDGSRECEIEQCSYAGCYCSFTPAPQYNANAGNNYAYGHQENPDCNSFHRN